MQRQQFFALIDEAISQGASAKAACACLGISTRTLARWRQKKEDGRKTRRHIPRNKLSEAERQRVLQLVNSQEFKDLPPSQIVPILAEQGHYAASESTMYRILRAEKMAAHRQPSRPARRIAPDPYTATGPNQVWSWDITYLPTRIRGRFLYLYLICDIYSRKIVGWEVHDEERAEHAAKLVHRAYLNEKIQEKPLVLHADNGSPMKGATMLATLQRLGVIPSFSRPSVSNDNPFSESLFRTLKYRPNYPQTPFEGLEAARNWVVGFVGWYNHEHRHSSLNFVTPDQRHRCLDPQILAKRDQTYKAARQRNPERWSGKTRDWAPKPATSLNPSSTANTCKHMVSPKSA